MTDTEKPCGCIVRLMSTPGPEARIEYCPLHAAAPELLEACEAAAEWAAGYPLQGACSEADARAAAIVFRLASEAIAAGKDGK